MIMWNINYKRHKLLRLLSIRHIDYWQKDKNYDNEYLTFNEVCDRTNWNKTELEFIYSELEYQNEVKQTVNGLSNCLVVSKKGILSYTNNKYVGIFFKVFLNFGKDISQIIIPVFSLFIAYKAITYKVESNKATTIKELKVIQQQLKDLQKQKELQGMELIDTRKDTISN